MAGHPTYQVNVIKLKRESLWTGGLPHLPGLPHPYVNRALNHTTVANAILLLLFTRCCQKTKDCETEGDKIIRNPVIAQRKKNTTY